MGIKKKIKLGLAEIFEKIGLNKLLLSFLSSNNIPIFTFHRVVRSNSYSGENVTCPFIHQAIFKCFLHHALSKFRFISLSELVEGISAGRMPKRCAAVTFDDGWSDNFDYAYPVLKELKIPATIFLVNGWIGTHRVPWSTGLNYLVKEIDGKRNITSFMNLLVNKGLKIPKDGRNDTRRMVFVLNDQLKKWPLDDIELFLNQASNQFGIEARRFSENRNFLNWGEISEMRDEQIDFGSHSQSHAILTNESEERVIIELKRSKEEIETKLGRKVVAFCYPNGNYDEKIIGRVRESGYEYACSTDPGWVGKKANIYFLKRIDIHQNLFEGIGNRIPSSYLDFILYDSHFRNLGK